MSPNDQKNLLGKERLEDGLVIIQRFLVAHKPSKGVLGGMYDYGTTLHNKEFPHQPRLGFKDKKQAIEYKTKLTIYLKQAREKHSKSKKSKVSIKVI